MTTWERQLLVKLDGVLLGGRGFGAAMKALFSYLGSEYGTTLTLGADGGCCTDWSCDILVAKKIKFFRRLEKATGRTTGMCSYFISSSCNFSITYYLVRLKFF
ncbi:uncharacterized protein LOC141651974 [Silene latifolia]|uniref:uncharacterized protein LOC141651974 n=1 Tax=Silene latifolia TaxID=37657 RepID=UPI003D7826C1